MAHLNIGGGISTPKTKKRFESQEQSDKYWQNYYDYYAKKYNYNPDKNKTVTKTVSTKTPAAAPAPAINPYQRLQELYDMQSKAAQSLYSNTISQYDTEKSAAQSKIDNSSNDAYQQAYLNHMLQKKEMPQLLAAMGISGGGAESTISSMQNSYGQSRNKIDSQRLQYLSDLEAQYAKLKSQAKTKFDEQMYEYDLQYQQSKAGL